MMEYFNTHPEDFSNSYVPFWIALMQFSGGFIAELTNLFMLATRATVEYCITFFVAFHVLTAIDNIYAEGLHDFALREAVGHPLVFKKRTKDIKFVKRSCHQMWVRVVFMVLSFLYYNSYYYFLPFLVNFIPYMSPGGKDTH